MPISEHPLLKMTLSETQNIYRYIGLEKLISIIKDSKLYFSRIREMQDIYEGKITDATIEKWRSSAGDKIEILNKNIEVMHGLAANLLHISCWNINENEDELLWSKYCSSNLSVCIESNIASLRKAFAKYPLRIEIGEVVYADFKKEIFEGELNIIEIGSVKNRYFMNERELRLFCMMYKNDSSISIPIDYKALIKRIIINPKASQYIRDNIRDIIEKYDTSLIVEDSIIKYW